MYSIELLVAEHENVLRLCRVIRGACLGALDTQTISPSDFKDFLHIIREYADKHHHGKEEQLLFKEMEDRLGIPAQKLVRNGMLVEHDLGRLYATQLDDAIGQYEACGSKDSLLDVITNAMAYADLLRRHINRENDVVYPFAQSKLSSHVLAELDESTHKFEEGKSEFLASILNTLGQLEQKYIC